MGLIERIDAFLLKNYVMLVLFLALVTLAMSFLLPISTFISYRGDLNKEINPTIINGILTVTAIVFAFVVFELREIESSLSAKLFLSFPLLGFLIATLGSVFVGAIDNKMTVGIALIATANCLFNIFYVFPITIFRQSRIEIAQRK
jgi:hypothetical protein